ncbi:MAG TPA: hypothetical protein VFZ11_01805 [Gemmatimonadaceae bacterium]
MRPHTFAASARRLSRRLAIAPLALAGLLSGCIAGETIAAPSSGAIPGRYVLTMFSSSSGTQELPIRTGTTAGENPMPIYLRYATIDMYADGTFVEVYEFDVVNSLGHVVDTRWDVGNGTWATVGDEIEFKAILRPALLTAATSWTGYVGGGDYAFNMRRYVDPPKGMHYRRY